MSDTNENQTTPALTPAQLAVSARVEELKKYKGKWFKRKDGKEGATQVVDYIGTKTVQGLNEHGQPVAISYHTFQVQAIDGRRWTPAATQFIAEHDEIESPETTSDNQPI